jgi:hypothetical protein
MSNRYRSAIVVVAVATSFARAESPTTDDPRLADLAAMPPPGEESGRADDTRDEDSISRRLLRGALFVPRIALEVVVAPVRGGIWAYERYQLKQRYFDLFFNDARTMGVYPTIALRTGYGVTVGAKFVHEDLFGERERVKAAVATGGGIASSRGSASRPAGASGVSSSGSTQAPNGAPRTRTTEMAIATTCRRPQSRTLSSPSRPRVPRESA